MVTEENGCNNFDKINIRIRNLEKNLSESLQRLELEAINHDREIKFPGNNDGPRQLPQAFQT